MENVNTEDEPKIVNALTHFSDAQSTSLISVNRQIESDITLVLDTDPKLWTSLSPYLTATGKAGGRVWDHARVAMMLEMHVPALRKYTNLTDHGIYERFVAVVKRRGFFMVGGYIIGHAKDNDPVTAEDVVDPVEADDIIDPVS